MWKMLTRFCRWLKNDWIKRYDQKKPPVIDGDGILFFGRWRLVKEELAAIAQVHYPPTGVYDEYYVVILSTYGKECSFGYESFCNTVKNQLEKWVGPLPETLFSPYECVEEPRSAIIWPEECRGTPIFKTPTQPADRCFDFDDRILGVDDNNLILTDEARACLSRCRKLGLPG